MKTLFKQIFQHLISVFIGLLVNALLTIIVTKIVDFIYNKSLARTMCVLCGSTGKRKLPNGTYIVCSCREKKKRGAV